MGNFKGALSACSSNSWWDEIEDEFEDLLKEALPEVEAAQILWNSYNILEDLEKSATLLHDDCIDVR
jgi:hypothetical protein